MVANSELQRVGLSGWRTGLANLLRKENGAWWATRRWLVQGVLWAVIVNGLVLVMMLVAAPMAGQDPLGMGIQAVFDLGSFILGVGTIILVQGAVVGERQLGVTEWLLSKPVSRPAYVLSKLLAHGLGVLTLLVGLPGAIAYGLLSLKLGQPVPPLPYLVGMVGLAVHTLFYLALTLMMGVLTANRNALLGVSLGVLLIGLTMMTLLGKFALLTPWALGKSLQIYVLAAVSGAPLSLPVPLWLPIGITAGLSVIFVAVALARFNRLEF